MKLKTIIFFVLFCSTLINGIRAQLSPNFKLSDTSVYTGQKLILKDFATTFRGNVLAQSMDLMDSIVYFLASNPKIIIEIGVHTDQRGKSYPNYRLSQQRADILKFDICERGNIDKSRIIAIGYGEDYPIIPIEFISNIKDIEEKEKLYSINRRVELQILEGNFFNKIAHRNKILSKYRDLQQFNFEDSIFLKNQEKIINGVITSIEGKILKDSLGQLDSLANLLANNDDLVIFISDLAHYGECDELDFDLGCQRDFYFRYYILNNKNVQKSQIKINEYIKKRDFYSVDDIKKRSYELSEPILPTRKFFIEIHSSDYSKQREKQFSSHDKIKSLDQIQKSLTNMSWKQSLRFSEYDIEYFSIPSFYITLINSNTWEDNKNIGIGINVFDKNNKDLVLLKDWTSDGSESKIIFTKSYVIQMDYLQRWSPKYNAIIDQAIFEIEQFFKENYESL